MHVYIFGIRRSRSFQWAYFRVHTRKFLTNFVMHFVKIHSKGRLFQTQDKKTVQSLQWDAEILYISVILRCLCCVFCVVEWIRRLRCGHDFPYPVPCPAKLRLMVMSSECSNTRTYFCDFTVFMLCVFCVVAWIRRLRCRHDFPYPVPCPAKLRLIVMSLECSNTRTYRVFFRV